MNTYFISFRDGIFYYEGVIIAESENKAKDIIFKQYGNVNIDTIDLLTDSDIVMLKVYEERHSKIM